jgi:hypothetical protein
MDDTVGSFETEIGYIRSRLFSLIGVVLKATCNHTD